MKLSDNTWYLLMTRWQLAWARLSGHLALFQLAMLDYRARRKRLQEETRTRALFTDDEITERKELRQSTQVASKSQEKRPAWYQRFLPSASSAEPPSEPFRLPILAEVPEHQLFTRKERDARMRSKLKQLRSAFQQSQRETLALLKRYQAATAALLPPDAVDEEIRQLEDAYHHSGRRREWFHAYKALALEVAQLSEVHLPDTEYNEHPIRLVQGDFVSQMRTRLTVFQRLSALRTDVFQTGDLDSIRMLSYFKSRIVDPDAFIDPPLDFDKVKQFLSALEYQHQQFSQANRDVAQRAQQSASADESQRLQQWLKFKQAGANDLSLLKEIAAQCQDWQHEVELFEADQEVRNLSAEHAVETNGAGLLEQFMTDLTRRIDAEINLDVRFQAALKRAISEENHPDKVELALKQLALARSRKDSEAVINQIKKAFVEVATDSSPAADVVPLFQRR